jgi:glyoxylase-like metal-dependent hydrolase (beta-lactamase superfamily II)
MLLNDHSDAEVHFLQIHLGGDRNWCYLFGDRQSGEGAVVDPGFEPDQLAELAQQRDLTVRYILITHGHGDHVGGAGRLAELTGATLYAGRNERVSGAESVADGHHFQLGQKRILCFFTPGHSPGHMVYLFEGRLMTGDLLFCGKVGGTGLFFAGSSPDAEWESVHRVMTLPDETLVFPGHDYYGGEGSMPHSTIAHERAHNPFLLCQDFEAFCHLKENWELYKKEHGIR